MRNIISRSTIVFLISAQIIFLSCQKDPVEILPVEPVQIDLTAEQVSLIESGNSFAFDIFRLVLGKSDGPANIIISPLSISFALSMTLNGAKETTRDAMLDALRVNGISPEKINQSYKALSDALLNVDKRILISIANSVWTEKNFVVKKPFTDILTGYYDAEAKSFDITNPLAHQAVNAWIEDKTNGLIKEMLDKLDPNAVMLLVNAIYFKGKWNSQFDKTNTLQKPFYKPSGGSSDVPMMRQTEDFKIFDGEGFILAEFPYGQGNFVMDLILPDSQNGTAGIAADLNENNFNSWLNSMRERETNVSFPRFKYGYKKKLKEILSSMGMGIAFTDLADFSNISNLNLMINEVTHQAFIETNEEGTEAAAATVVEIVNTSMPPPPLELNIDHSFLYIIRETTTNTILFMGRVDDPLAN